MYTTIDMKGIQNDILELAVKAGVAKNKTDAIGIGVLELNNKYKLTESKEDIDERYEAEQIVKDIKQGKCKSYTEAEFQEMKKKF